MRIRLLLSVIIILVLGFFIWQGFLREDFDLPKDGETVTETIVIQDGEVIGTQDEVQEEGAQIKEPFETKEIRITNGVKHSIPLEELLSGGPSKDGIPSIDNPKFISTKEAGQWLDDGEPGIAFSRGNTHRFYPYQIMVWHEIVNDIIEGERVLVTYCPLCLTGFVLDPLVKGERVEFGTSGKLWKSNLVMYDRKTDSLWPQVLAEAVIGEMTGTKLKVLPSDQALYGNWKQLHPDGQVLSRDTGTNRFYGSNPYGDYFSVTNLSLSLVNPTDTRLPNDAFVFGIVIDSKAKAYATESVKAKGVVEDTFENTDIVLRYDKDLEVVRMFKKLSDGQEERINPISSFWFSWAVAYPQTDLYK